MNYCIYNELKFSYKQIDQCIIKNNNILLEIVLSSDEECLYIWEQLQQQDLNLIFQLYNNKLKLNFILKECYTNNTILILKGEGI